jgi:NAD(P)-dependent dehydrogenase (short-subunit alcohol dehydrogenase family)
MGLKDKTIVVTGGSRGLGLGLVEALVDRGAYRPWRFQPSEPC